MKYNQLGRSSLNASEYCLGTMTWGEQNTQAEAFEQMDYAANQGINILDTAELYAIPPKRETQGATEDIIGNYFKERKNRKDWILATKVTGPSSRMDWFRKDGSLPRLDE
ncbi:Tas protein, an NADP(H)-dependent aldo-keto reductase, partial [hydrothermal vent metagenome]